jgi:hypothetical protein
MLALRTGLFYEVPESNKNSESGEKNYKENILIMAG